jgi:pyridoxine kinase
LTASLPIISACGVECNVLPTALLSTHTGGFEGYTFCDLTKEMDGILAHWKNLGLKFDFIYSGYLGSIAQIETVLAVKKNLLADGGKFIVDPVMGDSGELYAGFTAEYVEKMRELCRAADYILPNVTEACYLADIPYPLTKENTNVALTRLSSLCVSPIVTGILGENGISVYYKNGNEISSLTHENVEGFFCGAGDVFASAFVGCLARGVNIPNAVYLASDFVADVIRRSAKEVSDKRYGLNFEAEIFPFLQKLNNIKNPLHSVDK